MSTDGLLYSFRRCPYAIRARLALAAVGASVEVREVALKAKPPELLEASPKGTVPVLVLPTGETLSQSLEILLWARERHPEGQKAAAVLREGEVAALVAECDGPFKGHLDGFRYGSPQADAGTETLGQRTAREEHRQAALAILRRWNTFLERGAWAGTASGPIAASSGPEPSSGSGLSTRAGSAPLDWALLPFVRQFRRTDPEGFAAEPGLEALRTRLAAFEASGELARVMAPPWAWRDPWRSPRWLYHLALEEDWQEALRQGIYTQSTRGQSLAEVGFIHACWSHQLEPTWRRFYADDPALRLLSIDPERLAAAAIPVREEPAPGSVELFPHIYGALPIDAVRLARPWDASASEAAPTEAAPADAPASEAPPADLPAAEPTAP
jgi:glutathione S-transferase